MALVVLYFARYFFLQKTPEFLSFILVNPFTPLNARTLFSLSPASHSGAVGSMVSMRKFLRI